MEENLDPRTVRFRKEYQDKHFFTKDGREEFIITDARTYGDVDITFVNSGLVKNTKIGNIKAGLANPFIRAGTHGKPGPVAFDTPQGQYNGCIYKTNYDGYIKILNYNSYEDVTYQFLDESGHIGSTTIQNIKKGQVRNPYKRNSMGGYLGIGEYRTKEYETIHSRWYLMLTRVTGQRERYREHTNAYMNVKAYENVLIDPEWFCYNTFAQWYISNINLLNTDQYDYDVDKDLLYPYYAPFTYGKKCYSQYTCVLLPRELNVTIARFNSVGMEAKEKMKQDLEDRCNCYFRNGALSLDSYCVIRRFYLEDPQYADYVTIKFNAMKSGIVRFRDFDPHNYNQLPPIASPNV